MKAGVALNPHTPVESVFDLLDEIDLVCVMSVNPGFGGQKFIPLALQKIRALRKRIAAAGVSTLIEIDGGVTLDNAASIVEAGADVLVAGSSVFGAIDPRGVIRSMKSL
jgi:ribulose-phosphate 3-epimerase